LLKAKCANVNMLRQGGIERHDEEHIKILGRCIPKYLRDTSAKLPVEKMEALLKRLFSLMQTPAAAGVLWHVDLSADALVPGECQNSANPKIKELCQAEMPRCREAIRAENYNPSHKPEQDHPPMMSLSRRRKGRTTRRF
jgi:hypothetical protein